MSEHRTARSIALAGLFALGLIGGLTAGQPAAHAATFTVTTFADVTSAVDGLTSLREAVANANAAAGDDTIVLTSGTYQLTNCAAGLSHTDAAGLTVQGNGATVVQTCLDTGVLESTDDASTLTLVDLGVEGGPNSGAFVFAPGVYGEGAVHLDTVTITGVDGGPSGAGAAVSGSNNVPGAPMTIVDSSITGNDAKGVGGSNVSLVLAGSTVTGNGGAGINLTDGTPLTITDSTVSANGDYGVRTTGQGHTRVTVTDSTINGNASTGVLCSACGSLEVTSSTVNANGDGGIDFSFDLDPVGADRHVTLTNAEVDGNAATGPGGGIAVTSIQPAPSDDVSPVLTLVDSSVSGNSTTGSGSSGGGVYSRVGKLVVDGSTIHDNRARGAGSSGGGIYFKPDTDGLSFARHGATIIDSTIGRNRAAGNGGGAYLDSDSAVQVIASRVSGNTAGRTGRGGGLWARESSPLLIEDATLSGNQAWRGGGAYVAGRTGLAWAVVDSSTLHRNRAGQYGGGLLVAEGALVTVQNSTVSGNRAEKSGGGMQVGTLAPARLPVQGVTIDFTTVRGNRAQLGANLGARNGVVTTRASVFVAGTGPGCTFGAAATLAAGGYSFTDHAACAGAATDVLSAASAQLGPLADNGGPTATHLPAATSPLVDLVPLVACTQPLDQRGVLRPQGTACEPGSVEIGKRRS